MRKHISFLSWKIPANEGRSDAHAADQEKMELFDFKNASLRFTVMCVMVPLHNADDSRSKCRTKMHCVKPSMHHCRVLDEAVCNQGGNCREMFDLTAACSLHFVASVPVLCAMTIN